MPITVDARGLPCPQPVIQTRQAFKEAKDITTIVDNETSRHNVTKMAEKQGYRVQSDHKEDGIYLHISKGETSPQTEEHSPSPSMPTADSGPLTLVVPDEFMGRGDPELGGILIRAFFHTLGEVEPLPQMIIFLNSGVKLVVEDSKVLEDLQALEQQGIEILACGTCLGHYELKEKLRVGEISNMYTIAEAILNAGKVINL